ncbi:DUF4345 family protein [Chloroflexota bacterium]
MTFLEILKAIMAVVTIATGLISLIRPRSVQGFTGLSAPGPRGITEIRAILGGAFIGLGLAPLILGSPAAYQMLGITYLVIAVARFAGIVLDRSFERSNWISLVVEVVAGIILLL